MCKKVELTLEEKGIAVERMILRRKIEEEEEEKEKLNKSEEIVKG